jgi:hypothetical protein
VPVGGQGSATAGSGVLVGWAGRGGDVAGMMAAAGSGAAGQLAGTAGELAAAGSGGADSCPTSYTTATHIVINVTWSGSLALSAGSGKIHVWSKSETLENGSTGAVVGQSCGSVLPAVTTSAIAGNEKILPEMLDAIWDKPTMPRFTGTLTKSGNTVTVDPGVALLGLSMSNPLDSWPAATSITGVDHDGDGFLGVTSIPKTSAGFSAPPTDLGKSHRADKLYLAIRNIMTLSSTFEGCPETTTGTATIKNFENHVIGCHVQNGGACNSDQISFVDSNRTVFKLGGATFTSQRVDADATCADVRAALPMQ